MNISNNIASLQVNQTFMNANANNVANVNTDGFVPKDVRITNSQTQTPQADVRSADNNGSPKSQTNLAKEIPDQITIGGVTSANVKAIQTQDEMLGSLLDIKT